MGKAKKNAKHRNDKAIVADEARSELLSINDDTPFMMSTDGERFVIAPVRNKKRNQKLVDEALADTNKRYGKMLKRHAQ